MVILELPGDNYNSRPPLGRMAPSGEGAFARWYL